MELLFKERLFSWFDSYDIYDAQGNTIFQVQGQLSWGHCLQIYDAAGNHLGTVKEKVLTFLPRFELYEGEKLIGHVQKELTFFKPRYAIDVRGWDITGSFWEWDYQITDLSGNFIASISKEIWHLTDTYVLNIANSEDALHVLMLVLAIDTEKCSRN